MKMAFDHSKPCKDHTGKRYPTLSDMCKAYNIKLETFRRRTEVYKWSLEKALTTPVKPNGGQYCYDHNGTRFKSVTLMCEHWGIDRKTYSYRIKQGLSVEEALTLPPAPGVKLESGE